jgi:hypothetical protein
VSCLLDLEQIQVSQITIEIYFLNNIVLRFKYIGSFHAEVAGDEEAPSNLTSGGVVCGSLAAALRHRPVACWGVSRAENQCTSTQAIAATSTDDQPPNDPLLDTAQQWRENYSQYREQNGYDIISYIIIYYYLT